MNKIFLFIMALGTMIAQSSCAGESNKAGGSGDKAKTKTLVVYFSQTGNTEGVARQIASITGADTWRIEPKQPYTDADLDYMNPQSRSSKENSDPAARPELKEEMTTISRYDTIYLGYPIWWGIAPRIIETFLESHNLEGKTIIPFCTSGSSSIGQSDVLLHKLAPKAKWKHGRRFEASPSLSSVEKWVKGIKN